MSPIDPHAYDIPGLGEARRRLAKPRRREAALPLLGAAALLAISAFVLAGAVILGPFWQTKDSPAAAMAQAFR